MKLSEEVKKALNEDINPKFKKGDKVKIVKSGYAGLYGKIVNEPLNYKGKIYYDVEVLGGETDNDANYQVGRKGETNFQGESFYKKIVQCDENTIKKT